MSKSPIVHRIMANELLKAFKQFPIISVSGPRQSGKTTLCHLLGPTYQYINLELDDYKNYAKTNPKQFLEQYQQGVVLDEVQAVPELFPYLQQATDSRNKAGEYILSGSQNFILLEKITQSLAGRVAMFSLLPFSLKELSSYINVNKTAWHILCFKGFYPRLFTNKNMQPTIFYKSYVNTYVQKDISTVLEVKNTNDFKKFIKLCAHRVGSVFNANDIGKIIGVDSKTITKWFSVLESSYIAYTLPAYYNNLDKRVVKKPKLYFYDTGLLCYLLGIKTHKELLLHSLHGNIFENFIINEIKKDSYNKGLEEDMYFWQDSNQNEIDLIIEKKNTLYAYEIKSTVIVQEKYFTQLTKFSQLAKQKGQKVKTGLIYGGEHTYKHAAHQIYSWQYLLEKTF
jgi:uncharacterized protein